ncbi:hypothetical protein [Demequina litorisediminis]|uniref:Uncharacterized protein n=1 Tax=Demequina litorisediminis TaxID=1849022 RepID=A0ABQ6IL44_9MICO|nr:hypothetical protein [Demequina litorisediminis]GMA37892.1 hypothetical protein GCM10025876_40960 [Demequina litorisediminis]
MTGSSSLVWDPLLAETRLATELTITGLRHLAQAPTKADIWIGSVSDVKAPSTLASTPLHQASSD